MAWGQTVVSDTKDTVRCYNTDVTSLKTINSTVPLGTYEVVIECWGAGGAGGLATGNTNAAASGGGGGGYAKSSYIVTSASTVKQGDVLNATAGAGGSKNGSGQSGKSGGDSYVTLGSSVTHLLTGGGGVGGADKTSSGGQTTVGSGGVGSDGNVDNQNGGAGGAGYYNSSAGAKGGGGGGAAGYGHTGGTGGTYQSDDYAIGGDGYFHDSVTGSGKGGRGGYKDSQGSHAVGGSGSIYGGGGGGAILNNSSNSYKRKGGNGANGFVRIVYVKRTITITRNYNYAGVSNTTFSKLYMDTVKKNEDLANPTRAGYVFKGWNTKEDGTGTTVTADFICDSIRDFTLYAQWRVDGNICHLHTNGGVFTETCINSFHESGIDESETAGVYDLAITSGSAYSNNSCLIDTGEAARTHFTKTGYTFKGWYTNDGANGNWGNYQDLTDVFTGSSNVDLYAKWTAKSITVKFNGNKPGSTDPVVPNNTTATYDGTYPALGNATCTGYSFQGWFMNTEGTGTQVTQGTTCNTETTPGFNWSNNSITLYAKWEARDVSVTFDGNGGTPSVSPKTYKFDQTYGNTLPTATRTGYNFDGWYTAVSGGTKIDETKKCNNQNGQSISFQTSPGSLKLYAHWTAKTITVKFNGNKKEGSSTDPVVPSNTTATYDGTYPALGNASRTGYTFQGWFLNQEGTGTQVTQGTACNTATTPGFDWDDNPNSITLYAKWTAKICTVTFKGNAPSGATVTPTTSTKTETFDANYVLPADPTCSGYDFKGWFTASSGGTQVTTSVKCTTEGNHELYARWDGHPYTVTFNKNTTATVTNLPTDPKTVKYKYTYGSLPSPSRTGYTFKGWYKESSCTNKVESTTTYDIIGNSTLWAKWEANTYSCNIDDDYSYMPCNTDPFTVTYDQTLNSSLGCDLRNIHKNGYSLTGLYWTRTGSGTIFSEYNYSDPVNPDAKWTWTTSKTIYPTWTISTPQITLDATNGGTADGVSFQSNGKYTYSVAYYGVNASDWFSQTTNVYGEYRGTYIAGYYVLASDLGTNNQISSHTPTRIGYTFDYWYYPHQKPKLTIIQLCFQMWIIHYMPIGHQRHTLVTLNPMVEVCLLHAHHPTVLQ